MMAALTLILHSISLHAEDTAATEAGEASADTVDTTEPVAETGEPADDSASADSETDTPPETSPDIPPRQVPYPHASRHLAIQNHLSGLQRSDEVVQLIDDQQSFYGLFLPGRSGQPQGGVLILHDLEQHGHWPVLVGPLRETLPDHGWATLAIELPAPYRATSQVRPIPQTPETPASPADDETTAEPSPEESIAPEAETQAEPEAETDEDPQPATGPAAGDSDADPETTQDNEPPLPRLENLPPLDNEAPPTDSPEAPPTPAFDEKVTGRILAGLQYLADRGQLNQVIIAIGDSAPLAANAVAVWQRERQEEKGITLVMVDPREHPYIQLPLAETLKALSVPMLDLITTDNRMTDWQLQARRGMMKRLHNDQYWQIRQNNAGAAATTTARRIRGWLKKHAAGTELP